MAEIKKQLDSLLDQKMDRKSFLKYSGGIILAALGITGLLRILLGTKSTSFVGSIDTQKRSRGYGSSRYGE